MDLKTKIERYMKGYCWLFLHDGDKSTQEQYPKVEKRVEELETELRTQGVTDNRLKFILERCEALLNTKFYDFSEEKPRILTTLLWGKSLPVIISNKD